MEILFHNLPEKKDRNVFAQFLEQTNDLAQVDTKNIVKTYDEVSKYWLSKSCKTQQLILEQDMGFIIPWLKERNINNLLNLNFNNCEALDRPVLNKKSNIYFYGRPAGLAVHWIAGNVPVLGVISLFQSLLTKNKSIIKAPLAFKNLLPQLLVDLLRNDYFDREIRKTINILLSSVMIVYIDKEDDVSQQEISRVADVRVMWGGLDAVESVMNLQKKLSCKDIVFGPKLSLAFVGKDKLKGKADVAELAALITNDVFAFNQAGCNSPHNLIVEKGSTVSLREIADTIKLAFEEKSKSSNVLSDDIDIFNILTKHFVCKSYKDCESLRGESNEWHIFYNTSGNLKIEDPLYSRSIFISETPDLETLGKQLPENIQSLGLFVDEKERLTIISTLSEFGVDRFPDLGKMSLFQHPWDGCLPLQNMVKWISSA